MKGKRRSYIERSEAVFLRVLLEFVQRDKPVQILDNPFVLSHGGHFAAPKNGVHVLCLEDGSHLR